jgi:hypothetical protein
MASVSSACLEALFNDIAISNSRGDQIFVTQIILKQSIFYLIPKLMIIKYSENSGNCYKYLYPI